MLKWAYYNAALLQVGRAGAGGVSLFRPMDSAASVGFQKAFKFEDVAVAFQWEQNSTHVPSQLFLF